MFMVISPHTYENDTNKYRVVHAEDWLKYRNGATTKYAFTAWDTYELACAAVDVANETA